MAASGNVKVAGAHFGVKISMEGVERWEQVFKDARNAISRDVREMLVDAADQTVLPSAKSLAPRFIAPTLVVRKGLRNSAYMTTTLRGKKGRVVGLLEFGGTVRKWIVPRHRRRGKGHAPALRIGNRFVAKVKAPRHYHGKHFMTKGIERERNRFYQSLEHDVLARFAR